MISKSMWYATFLSLIILCMSYNIGTHEFNMGQE